MKIRTKEILSNLSKEQISNLKDILETLSKTYKN